jgi:uncharacterized protein YajQ (UPF0234 family)
MPSFDVVSEVDKHELTNAVDTAIRDIQNRLDRKSTRLNSSHNPASRMPSSA